MRIIKIVLLLCLLVLLVGCSDHSAEEHKYGNQDAGSLYFSSHVKSIECDMTENVLNVFPTDGNICVVTRYTRSIDNDSFISYRAYMIDDSIGELRSKIELDLPNPNDTVYYSFCFAGDNRIACSHNTGFLILDMVDGSIVANNTDYNKPHNAYYSVSSCEDGFVLVTDNDAYKFDSCGDRIDTAHSDISFETLPTRNVFFEKGEKEYIAVDERMSVSYYECDFEKDTITKVADSDGLGLERNSSINYGGYAYDQFSGTIYDVDVINGEKAPCSYTKNMLIYPDSYVTLQTDFFILDKSKYVLTRQYTGGIIEIQILEPDDELDIDDRINITVKGDNATFDKALAMAAYQYNVSQDEYYISIENYGSEYSFSTTEEAQARTLKLIQEFQSDNAPDIFYGNSFDYNYMGDNGLVLDIMPYIEHSQMINDGSVSDNIYALFVHNGHCYQVFSGYQLFGLFGDRSLVTDKSCDLSLYENAIFSNMIRDRYSYSDMMSILIAYPLYEVRSHPEMLNKEVLSRMARIAVDVGISPEDQIKGDVIANDNENTFLSQFGTYDQFQMMTVARGKTFTYIGFPTVGACGRMAYPMGLVAISSGTEYPDACFDFIEYLYHEQVQRVCLANKYIPVNQENLEEYFSYLKEPESIPEDDLLMKYLVSNDEDPRFNRSDIIDSYISSIDGVDGLLIIDWGIHLIVSEEINSYCYQDKDIDSIADSLRNRIMIYLKENSLYGY